MPTLDTDFYELLGVSRDADGAVLKSAYRKLADEMASGSQPGRCRGGGAVQGDQRRL